MLQFDIRVTTRERNNDMQRVVEFDYDDKLRDYIQSALTDYIEEVGVYSFDQRTFEFTIADIKVVK